MTIWRSGTTTRSQTTMPPWTHSIIPTKANIKTRKTAPRWEQRRMDPERGVKQVKTTMKLTLDVEIIRQTQRRRMTSMLVERRQFRILRTTGSDVKRFDRSKRMTIRVCRMTTKTVCRSRRTATLSRSAEWPLTSRKSQSRRSSKWEKFCHKRITGKQVSRFLICHNLVKN